MPSEPIILAFDTSAAHSAAALLRGDDIQSARVEAMTRGQAERLMPLLEELLTDSNCAWSDLDAIGVGTGPGNFTGIRISVSAARGLALGLGVPAIGVTGFEALSRLAPQDQLAAIPAPREQIYVHPTGQDPQLIPQDAAAKLGQLFICDDPKDHVCAIAHIAAQRASDPASPPAPLYIRAADAAPSKDRPPVLLDE
ncbi:MULTISPECIES: tRNA (adenosine(37)-N6)-threonylcarbamoyltransferase complex dimerization subunit type 1 TsaB [unclassified Ruegeria]|uniref:tRNA (adenosine(37)-N6)-threonylcarbamoyltransferase complex dimerization subunit type 1 TsaB n=1 Tax=unclassified Ruegeria TaxID=2625375 RepID=UPI001489F348|nr:MULTISPECIES: tRNA (adenosine(37)-N6)-threonylcarbamoyltransferase complex dimerization subunit type 1 TsaB [unclassified Ruegeria]